MVPIPRVPLHLPHFTGDPCWQPNDPRGPSPPKAPGPAGKARGGAEGVHFPPTPPRTPRSGALEGPLAALTLCRNSRATFRSMAGPDRTAHFTTSSFGCGMLGCPEPAEAATLTGGAWEGGGGAWDGRGGAAGRREAQVLNRVASH